MQNVGSPDDFVEATLFTYIAYFELFYVIARCIDFIVRFPYWMGVAYRKISGQSEPDTNTQAQAVWA